jgi:hypothetical protein
MRTSPPAASWAKSALKVVSGHKEKCGLRSTRPKREVRRPWVTFWRASSPSWISKSSNQTVSCWPTRADTSGSTKRALSSRA